MNHQVNFNIRTILNGHHRMTYRGVRITKYPFDYVIYQMILFELKPDLVIEVGTDIGGGALYIADLLDIIGNGIIHTIDVVDQSDSLLKNHKRIKLFTQGWENYDLKETEGHDKILVIEDSSHMFENTLAVMYKFSPLVSVGSYLIVEDSIVTTIGLSGIFDGGPLKAIEMFMPTHPEFIVDRKWCDFFGQNATANVNGYLKKVGVNKINNKK